AIPFLDAHGNPTGILYASRRKIDPYSLTENLLLQRVRNIVDAITHKRPSKKLNTTASFQSLVAKKTKELLTLLLKARNIQETEETYTWKILMWPGIALPMKDWPEAEEDIVNACQIVIERQEKQQRVQENQKASWFKDILQAPNREQLFYEGLRLGLPVNQ